jgi:hypothetical protein
MGEKYPGQQRGPELTRLWPLTFVVALRGGGGLAYARFREATSLVSVRIFLLRG